jgi:ACS family hexuronate transporter-like MFS transporter
MFPRSAVGSVTGIGTMAGALGGFLFSTYIGYILQLTHGDYSILFVIAASVYLISLSINILLAPGLKKVELSA